jgi:23S rRNA pseudouridine1911/1915/1917 synthase
MNASAIEENHHHEIRTPEKSRQEIWYDLEEYGIEDTENIRIYEHNRIKVDPGQEPERVDIFLARKIRNLSRSRIKNAAEVGFIRVNGEIVKVSQKVKPYDEITIIMPYPPAPDLQPENIPLDILYEDDHLILINKQAGLVCHPGCGNYSGTLINALLYHFNRGLEGGNSLAITPGGDPIRPGLVHRIDKDTTGILCIAKTESAYTHLARQFFERTTDRNYYALVWGDVKQDSGTIVGHIGRSVQDRKRFMVFEDGSMGKHAITHYQVLQRFGVATLVKCKLETGRTHQIRVHFKYLGHTLFGDSFYGGNRILRGKPSKAFQRFIHGCFETMPRQALHARTLGFTHPATQERMHFSSPLPRDFHELILKMCTFMNTEPLEELKEKPSEIPTFDSAFNEDEAIEA